MELFPKIEGKQPACSGLKNHEGVFRQLQNVDPKAQDRTTNFLRELITCISWPLHELIPIFVYVIHLRSYQCHVKLCMFHGKAPKQFLVYGIRNLATATYKQ